LERKLRRVITGHNAEVKSVVIFDGGPGQVIGSNMEMWATNSTPANNSLEGDAASMHDIRKVMKAGGAPANGSLFRLGWIRPEDPSLSTEELEQYWAEFTVSIGTEHLRPDTTRDPRMHRTKMVDYIILLEGELTMFLDEGEVNLKPFDVVIQRGTNHAWINKSSKPALLAAVMIDAESL
jgi:mannose-6-phosphate isomerase-like protein (cupin superfamily)